MIKLINIILYLLFLTSCVRIEEKIIDKKWELSRVYFNDSRVWGVLNETNQFSLIFLHEGILKVEKSDKIQIETDLVNNKSYWKRIDDSRFHIDGFDTVKIITINDTSLVFEEGFSPSNSGRIHATYYFKNDNHSY